MNIALANGKTAQIPEHAAQSLAALDWSGADWVSLSLAGLLYSGVALLGAKANGECAALILSTDFDIDIDGLGGSKATDRYYQAETSLRTAAGTSLDSREFTGYVMAPALKQFGVRMGDFGLAIWGGRMVGFQVYDQGPTTKAGEGSIRLGRELGLIWPSTSDYRAANSAPPVNDVSAIIFPRSAPGTGESVPNHALPVGLIERAAAALLQALRK